MKKPKSRFWLLLTPSLWLGTAVATFPQSEEAGNLDVESSISNKMSNRNIVSTLENCLLTVSISYSTQCFPGVDVGLVSEDIIMDLREFSPHVLIDSWRGDPGWAALVLEYSDLVAAATSEMLDAQDSIVMSSQSLPPLQRQALISETMATLLDSREIKSRILIKSCVGGPRVNALPSAQTRVKVPSDTSVVLGSVLQNYIETYCQSEQ